MNRGKCKDVNKCRCEYGYEGDHCEIVVKGFNSSANNRCAARCRHGVCSSRGHCSCHGGYTGRWCRRSK